MAKYVYEFRYHLLSDVSKKKNTLSVVTSDIRR